MLSLKIIQDKRGDADASVLRHLKHVKPRKMQPQSLCRNTQLNIIYIKFPLYCVYVI